MYKLDNKIRQRLDKITEELYACVKSAPEKEMRTVSAPTGSLIIAPRTMSKKDFQFFLSVWMDCMEKLIKKAKSKKKK